MNQERRSETFAHASRLRALAGVALLLPLGLAARAQGILTVTPGRTVTTAAGTGAVGYTGDGSAATSATLATPAAVAYDASGNLYIADAANHVIREVLAASGNIVTVAGTGVAGFGGDGGAATSAFLDTPTGVAVDASGNVYIADSHNQRIRKVSAGTISTVAGTGTAGFSGDGVAASAALNLPSAVAVDASGNVFLADTNNQRVREITGTTISTVAGTGEQNYTGDGGAATSATLDSPVGVAVDASGNVYIADRHNQRIREVSGGNITTVAGSGAPSFAGGFGGDGGSATAATLARPRGVAVDAAGNVYLADTNNQRVREVANVSVTTIAGTGNEDFLEGGVATAAAFATPRGLAVDARGNVAVGDTLNQRVRLVALPAVAFGSQALGGTSSSQTVVLSNTGAASLTVSSFALPSGVVVVSGGTCSAVPVTISAGGSCSVALAYRPMSAAALNGAVTFSGSGLVPQTLLVTGTAVAQQPAVTGISPASGPPAGGTSVTITGTNLTGTSVVTFGGANATSFTVVSDTSVTAVSPAGTGTVDVVVGNGTYTSATGAADRFSYVAAQVILFTQPATPAFVQSTASLVATGGASGNPVTFSIVSGPATLSGTNNATITYTGAGTVVIAADQAGSGNYAAAAQVTRTVVVVPQSVFIVNSGGSVTTTYDNGAMQASSVAGGGIGAAVDASGSVWSINTDGNGVSKFNDAGGFSASYTGAGISGAKALAIDGSGVVWIANSGGTVSALTSTGASASPVPLAAAGGISAPASIAVDAAGSLWIASSGNDTVTEVIGAAAPVTAPTVQQVIQRNPGARP